MGAGHGHADRAGAGRDQGPPAILNPLKLFPGPKKDDLLRRYSFFYAEYTSNTENIVQGRGAQKGELSRRITVTSSIFKFST